MTSDILKRAAEAVEWLPCPLCGAELQAEGDGVEHPASDTCPLDSLWLLPEHSAAWNRRIPDMAAAIAERDEQIARLKEDRRQILEERDRTFALMLARAEAAEAMADRLAEVMNDIRDYATILASDGQHRVLREVLAAHAAMKEGR